MADQDSHVFDDLPRGEESNPAADAAPPPDSSDPLFQQLLKDPEIRAAFDAGDPRELETVLQRKRRSEIDPHLCSKLDELLQDRRLFVRPIQGAPTMLTFNGCGTTLYGRQEFNPADGTHFATLWITLLFIPLIPLREYLVRDVGGGQYQFLGKVSFSQKTRRIRQIVFTLALAAVAGVIATSWYSGRNATVHFVNGLDVPVTIAIDDQRFQVDPDSRASQRLPVGMHSVRVTGPQEELLEEQDVKIPGRHDLVAYNVLGVAPLLVEDVVYSGKLALNFNQQEPDFKHYIGERLILRDGIEYVFEDPPNEISISSNTSVQRRKHAFVLSGGWQTSLNVLSETGDMEGAATLVESVAQADLTNTTAARLAWGLIDSVRGQEQGLHFIEQMVAKAPDAVEFHRIHQEALKSMGQQDKAREIYRRMADEHPDSPMAAYLAARTQPMEEQCATYRQLLEQFPDYYYIVNGCAYSMAMSRQFKDAAPLFERARTICPEDAVFPWELYLESLVAAGRVKDAIDLFVKECQCDPDSISFSTAIRYGQLARALPDASLPYPADHYLKALDVPVEEVEILDAWFQLLVYGEVAHDRLMGLRDEDTCQAIDLCLAARRNPEQAIYLAEATTEENIASIDDTTLLLLACEASRLGRGDLAHKLFAGTTTGTQEEADALERFVFEGTESDVLAELDLVTQATLHHARARRAQAAGENASQHFANARADDVFHTAVTDACDHWPSAGKHSGK